MLEQEVKLLKSQIQKTLLDIQEQILIHYHPTLRAENESFAEENGLRRETAVPHPTPTTAPKLRQVSLADIKQNSSPTPATAQDDTFTALTRWVEASVDKIGIAQTRKLLELRAEGGYLAPDMQEMLLQLLALHETENSTSMTETAVLIQELNHLLD
ncbi:MAG: hypothetical protein H6658_04450 [Ardenticatenaceae bacterium]|nr:hypothetical protein [Ardenticatenaceae bacterium]